MTSVFPLALLLCLSSGLLTAYGAAPCPPGWTQFGSRCFAFYIQTKTWIDAETFCQTAGGNLASIHSAEEHKFLKDLIYQETGIDTNTWIGGFDSVQEGTWMWTDGSKFNYKIFNAGQPDNADAFTGENCLEMNFNGNNWNDRTCSTQFYFVCSKNLCV
ncbi:galactose-specific lectin nattectin-like isoform X1 [Perca flavescens]|uniref:galactose-specific lectin nattectin-like isoform X1 n=1 Tax=Perca flavescens TaxID=8167 RepID=UPI00106E1772|nr:galactose-specific lectin nattectin-like isoform X1 [Perca flavescens]XP_028446705.1 galactose-specific lectin nattectin-like isoform X1 [Perca flavescens]XP_028446706.1 galactose-specific lectin nattectin-like isoform X1 [Perca flavescens]